MAGWRSVPGLVQRRCARWRHRAELEWAGEIAPRLVGGLAVAGGGDWRTANVAYTSTSLTVVTVGSPRSTRQFVVKVPCTAQGVARLRRQAEVLATLHRDPSLRCLHPLIPRCVEQGEVGGRYYCIEDALPGQPASAILEQPCRATLLASATRVIGDLHFRTGRKTLIDSAMIAEWVHTPALRLHEFLAGPGRRGLLLDAVDRLRGELDAALAGRTVRTSWIHGDFWPGNLLADKPGTDVTGVVDWDGASARQLPLHDLLHLHVFFRRLAHGDELGDIVVRALHRGIDDAVGAPAAQVGSWLDGIPQRPAVLLYWLRHVVLFIDTEGHHDNPRWLRANVKRVLVNI